MQASNLESEKDLKELDKWVKDRVRVLKKTKENFDFIYKAIRKLQKMK